MAVAETASLGEQKIVRRPEISNSRLYRVMPMDAGHPSRQLVSYQPTSTPSGLLIGFAAMELNSASVQT